jgi:hypothetical protein
MDPGEATKGAQGRVGKQLLESKGPGGKTGIVTALKVQLTLSQGKKKIEDKVADDEDDDVVRISVSQD